MSPSHDDEAQRTLEQHALRNVQSLAERLGYRDLMDRATERKLIIAIAGGVALIIAVLGFRMATSQPDPRLEELKRCELDMAVRVVSLLRDQLKAADPGLTQAQLEQRVVITHKDVKQEAARRCASAS